jgi:hypothetical protein
MHMTEPRTTGLCSAEFRTPQRSLRAQRLKVAAELRARGADRISDAFILVQTDGPWPASYYATSLAGEWRDHRRDLWVRTAQLPFDLLPFRPSAPARDGVVFTLGHGMTAEFQLHPLVLLVQIEGPADAVEARRPAIADTCQRLASEICCEAVPLRDGWQRWCLAGIVPVDAAQPGGVDA